MNTKILVAEDEADVLQLIVTSLKAIGLDPVRATNGPDALRLARTENPALIVLDLMLPGMSGQEICRTLRAKTETAHIPIIMVTARAATADRVAGLELGADDYVTKPFSPRELMLRIQSVLRRGRGSGAEDVMKIGHLHIDRVRHVVKVKNKPVELTATEFKLLDLLADRRGRVQSRDRLLNDVWGYENVIDTRTVDTHVRRLRDKLGDAADCIETVRGFGYRMAE